MAFLLLLLSSICTIHFIFFFVHLNIYSYQKTSEAVKMGQASVMGTLGSVARKLGEVKNTNAFKSFEEKVGYAVTNVKVKFH